MKGIVQLLRDNAQREKRPFNLTRNQAGADSTLYLYDIISADWGASAQDMAVALAAADKTGTLSLHINSPGGDAFEGRAMASLLRAWQGKKVARIDSLCASAATTVALACDEVVMSTGSFFMIHNAWTFAYGDKNDLADVAALLNKIDGEIAADYVKATGAALSQVQDWMNAETWFTASEAVDAGFAASVAGGDDDEDADAAENRARTWNLAAYARAPKALIDRKPPARQSTPDWQAVIANNHRRLRLLELA